MKKLYLIFTVAILLQLNIFSQNGWELINKFNGYYDNNPIAFKDTLNGYALTLPGFVDSTSKIYQTKDGGTNWNEIIIPGLNFDLSHIIFVNNNCTIILGSSGKFIRSFDGGNTWSLNKIGDGLQIISACSTNDQKIFTLSSTGDLYVSINFGESWSKKSIATVRDYFSIITFVDPNIGFVARLGSLYKTTDGGENWFSVPYIDGHPQIKKIKFFNSNIGYTHCWDAYAGRGYVTKTTDAGTSWSVINTLVGDRYNDITVSKDNVLWVCYQISILCSIDSGKTWIKQYQTKEDWISSLYSVDSLTCFALGGNGYFYKTTNGGFSAPLLTNPNNGISSLPLTLNLSWSTKSSAQFFRLQVASDPNFEKIILDSVIEDTLQQIENLNLNTDYYWRVREEYQNINTPWSNTFHFKTTDGSPELVSPKNNSIDIPINTIFSWVDESLNAKSYQLQLSLDSTFNTLVYDSTTTLNSVQVYQLLDSTAYYWRVRAFINNGYRAWSDMYTFRTIGKTPVVLVHEGWFQQNPTPYGGNLGTFFAVTFQDANNITVAGNIGTIYRTTNGGTDWIYQNAGTSDRFSDISFIDVNNGWTVSVHSIFKTSDGGVNWSKQYTETMGYLRAITFVSINNGWAVGTNGIILKTTDGGINWTSQSVGTTRILNDVFFTDINNGWAVGWIYPSQTDSCIILRTTNGGETWQKQFSENETNLSAVYFTDTSNGTAVGDRGTILRTTDGGTNWSVQLSGTTEGYLDVCFTDINNGWVVGWNGILLKTTNGGTSWTYQSIGTSNHLYRISFFDSNNGIIVGDGSIILRTTNGGVTFVEEDNRSTSPKEIVLSQNYPNPFNPITVINYSIPKQSNVKLIIYDALGRELITLVNEEKRPGSYEVEFELAIGSQQLASGIYFYQLRAGDFSQTKKMVLLR